MKKDENIEGSDKAGFHVEDSKDGKSTVVVTDTDLFGKHLEKRISQLKTKQEEVSPDDMKIFGVSLNPIHLACIDLDNSPNHRLIEIKNNIASATNGTILVKIDLALTTSLTKAMLDLLNGKYIHMSVWAEICSCDSLQLDDDMIICNKQGINKMFEYSNPQGSMFSMNDVVEDVKMAGEEKKRLLYYDVKILSTLAKIFKTEKLHFSPSKGNHGTLVFPYYDCGTFAVMMPLELDKAENRYFFT